MCMCKGICIKFKAQKPLQDSRYRVGQSRCQTCDIFIKWSGIYCPCCGCRVRKNARNGNSKMKRVVKRI